MNARFRLAPCAIAVALLSSGCALMSMGGQQGGVPRTAAVQPAELAHRVPQPAELEMIFRLGREDLIAGRQRAAVERLRFVLEHAPRHVEALNALAVAAAEMGRQPDAVTLLRRAVAIAPSAVHLRNNLGHALYRAGDFAQARAELQAALQLQPDNAQALRNLALLDTAAVAAAPAATPVPASTPLPAAPVGGLGPVSARVAAQPAPAAVSAVAPQPSPAADAMVAPALPVGSGMQAGQSDRPGSDAPGLRDARQPARAEPPAGHRREPAVTTAPPPARPAPRLPQAEPRLVVQADGVTHLSEQMVLRILGLDGGGFVPATAKAAEPVQRVRIGSPDRRFEQRPVRGDGHVPQLIRAMPVRG